jgi:hypothetical protein
MSNAAPLIIILVLVGGIVTWGALTDWTFSGLLPRKGAKCTPDKDDKDENATEYVYDEDKKCTVMKKCKKDWEPNESNTACIYSDEGEVCTTPVSAITNADTYKIGPTGVCNLVKTCKIGWKPSSAATTCVVNAGATCTANTVYIENAVTYKTNSTGVCNLAKTCKTGWKPSDSADACVTVKGDACTSNTAYIKNVLTYAFDSDGKCNLVKTCKPGWRPSDDSKTCVDEFEPLTTVKEYQMKGYYSDQVGTSNGIDLLKADVTTVEQCRDLARKAGANQIGVRTSEHPDINYKKSCWYYVTWKPNTAEVLNANKTHYTECLDRTKKPVDGCV